MHTEKKHNTDEEIAEQARRCRTLFEQKTRDYGTSWRILRMPSLTDQIFIKANRIRSIQETGENRVGESVGLEFVALVNYSVMALMQARLPRAEGEGAEMDAGDALRLYDQCLGETLALMRRKNHDYGEAWRQMRISSMVDLILMKLLRIKQIEDNDGKTVASEGVEGGYADIVNYALFCLIRMNENHERD